MLLFDGTEIARHARCRGRHQSLVAQEHLKKLRYRRDADRLPSNVTVQEKEELKRGELERTLEEYEKAVMTWV